MREPANESLFTDVSRLRSYRCTIIVPTTSRAFVEREGCCASEVDKGHKRVGKGAQAQIAPRQIDSARAVPTRFRPVDVSTAWARRRKRAFVWSKSEPAPLPTLHDAVA